MIFTDQVFATLPQERWVTGDKAKCRLLKLQQFTTVSGHCQFRRMCADLSTSNCTHNNLYPTTPLHGPGAEIGPQEPCSTYITHRCEHISYPIRIFKHTSVCMPLMCTINYHYAPFCTNQHAPVTPTPKSFVSSQRWITSKLTRVAIWHTRLVT